MFKSAPPAPATVDEVISTFTDTISQLETVASNNDRVCEKQQQIITDASDRLQAAAQESERANKLKQKISDFLSVE